MSYEHPNFKIRNLSAIETRLAVAIEALEAALDIDEDQLRALPYDSAGSAFNRLGAASERLKTIQRRVRAELAALNATRIA